MALAYRVYRSPEAATPGNPVDFSAPVATVSGLTWTSPAIAPGSTDRFSVRAYDTATGLESIDATAIVAITTDASGNDASLAPPAPSTTSAVATAGGTARVTWTVAGMTRVNAPTEFRVYLGAGSTPSYASPAVIQPAMPYDGPTPITYSATISGLSDRVAYVVAVRGYRLGPGEGVSGPLADVVGDAVGPLAVDNATATPTPQVGR